MTINIPPVNTTLYTLFLFTLTSCDMMSFLTNTRGFVDFPLTPTTITFLSGNNQRKCMNCSHYKHRIQC